MPQPKRATGDAAAGASPGEQERARLVGRLNDALAWATQAAEDAKTYDDAGSDVIAATLDGRASFWREQAARYAAEIEDLDAGRVVVYAPDSPEALRAAARLKASTVREQREAGLPVSGRGYVRTAQKLELATRDQGAGARTLPRRATRSSGRPRARRVRASSSSSAPRGPDDGPGEPGDIDHAGGGA